MTTAKPASLVLSPHQQEQKMEALIIQTMISSLVRLLERESMLKKIIFHSDSTGDTINFP